MAIVEINIVSFKTWLSCMYNLLSFGIGLALIVVGGIS